MVTDSRGRELGVKAYIDLDDAVRVGLNMCIKVAGHGIPATVAVDVADAFDSIPKVDLVEVVRCKDCGFRIVAENIPEFKGRPPMICAISFRITGENEYCNRGIRKEKTNDKT